MAKRTHYRIIIEFTYSNGQLGGIIDRKVNAKSYIQKVLDAADAWLSHKGHTATKTTITPIPPTE